MKVAIACGGTGGHLFPGLAVAEVLRNRGHEILLLISEKQIDAVAVGDRKEFRIQKIPAVGLTKVVSIQFFLFIAKFTSGLVDCLRTYGSFKPDAVLGMGGFTSTGPILAGRITGLPTFIHEANAIPGKANRLNAFLSKQVLLGFEECARYFPNKAVEVTGTPIRDSLRAPVDRSRALRNMRLKSGLRTVLVMGGSQGAHGINEAVVTVLPRFVEKEVQFIHLTGKQDENYVYECYQKEGIPAFVSAFYDRMEEAYSVADLALARAGAASLTELSYFGLPTILIPYPFAAENHQLINAEIFARHRVAEVLEESRVNEDTLGSLIEHFLNNGATVHRPTVQTQAPGSDTAANRIVEIIEKFRK
ncbi:MAG: undecaprenyldiphospho-muramoylpentapeptide beta-N-acetylglucosaminyltransferase [Verrucomicrobia bacterium]|nr:undecaprenyldiphospho-muramoylpentapeptide beta-N-acetylglucosaminyltransferase [Verrucomicrobiota bacterium]